MFGSRGLRDIAEDEGVSGESLPLRKNLRNKNSELSDFFIYLILG
jgi:hypothetical protein